MKKPKHPPVMVPLWGGHYKNVKFADCTTVHIVQQVTAKVRVPPGNAPEIGEGSYIGLYVEFRGTVVVGRNCVIDSRVILEDCTIGDGCEIRPGCILQDCVIGDDCVIGPYAWVQSSETEIDVRVGFSAQVRRSVMESGARMDHFGYLGDTRVGAATTIGAGVVTANFDGKSKNKTFIGRRCLIGVNASLVACSPRLLIGHDVIVSAGSTVTRNVRAKHIAFGRAKQINKKRRDL